MVIVASKPLESEKFLEQFPADSVEATTINTLEGSSKKYYYDSIEQLNFELRLRKEIIAASYDLYNSSLGFAVFRYTKCNNAYWTRTDEGGFLLKEGVKPSDAINDIYSNASKYATECATAMVIVYYKALLNIYPESLFNKLFAKIQLMNWHYLDPLLREVGYINPQTDFLPGDRRYFANPDVNPLTLQWQGENVIDLDKGLYYGHGIGINKAEEIIAALNSNRKPNAKVSAYLIESAGRPNFKNLGEIYYKFISSNVA